MTTLPAAVQRVVDAINAADTEAFVAAFTSNGVVNDWGTVLRGSDGVRSWAGTDAIGQNATMIVHGATTTGDVTEIHFLWKSNRFNGESRAFVTVTDNLVSEFRIPSN